MAKLTLKKPLSKERQEQIDTLKERVRKARYEVVKKEAYDLLMQLRQQYEVFAKFAPLKVGIAYQLRKSGLKHSPNVINVALMKHTSSAKYHRNIAKGGKRYDLKGQPVQDIYSVHQRHAEMMLIAAKEYAASRKTNGRKK